MVNIVKKLIIRINNQIKILKKNKNESSEMVISSLKKLTYELENYKYWDRYTNDELGDIVADFDNKIYKLLEKLNNKLMN